MLRKIAVSGFKSLDAFELEFKPGLNVIVGPNGSGKTNIINFLEFLSFISRDSLLEAVGRSGGAGRIFRRNNTGSLTKTISFEIRGDGTFQDYRRAEQSHVSYEFAAEIQLSENNSAISFKRQRLKIAVAQSKSKRSAAWPIDIEFSASGEEESSTTFHSVERTHLEDQFLPKSKEKSDYTEQISEQIREFCREYARTRALYQFLDRYIVGLELITRDLFGAQSFNISPTVVRTPEDIASEPEIAQDGKGLAATLFALTSAPGGRNFPHSYLRRRTRFLEESRETVEAIISYSKLVNDSIERIWAAPDTVEAKLRIFISVRTGTGTMTLPFSLVSDGTAKWFALVTAIMTTSSVFAIEEPENYLHPLMQKEIVKIVRSNFDDPDKQAFAVMTTHSETILNSIDPSDMILVHMEDGKTVASRPTNADDIRLEIQNTGFGAGYYYIAGAIE